MATHGGLKIRLLKVVDQWLGSALACLLPAARMGDVWPVVPERILVVRPGGIGDAVLLVPALQALKTAFPGVSVEVLAERRNHSVFMLCPEIDRTFCYDRRWEILTVLRRGYDLVIDTEQWHRLSAVVSRFICAPMKIGYATNARRRLFSHPVPYSQNASEGDSFFSLLRPLGIDPPEEIEIPFLKIGASAGGRVVEALGDFLERPFAVLFPGASIPERRWGAEKFQALAAALAMEGILSVVVGGREDAIDGAKIVTGTKCLSLAGRTSLAETAAVIDKCSVLVSGDSGILHFGVGLGKPTVSLFGPGIAKKWAPRGREHIVLNKNLPCSPCTMFGNTPKCPVGARCLQEITVEEVTAAVIALVKRIKEGTSR